MSAPPSCPECEGAVQIPAEPLQGEVLPYDDCGAELEVVGVAPVELGVAPEVQEDWGE